MGTSKLNVTIKVEDGYLHACATGENTPDQVVDYLSQVRAACAAHGVDAVLIEENLKGPQLPLSDLYNVVYWGVQHAQPLPLAVAFVNRNPEHTWDNIGFAETAAVNRGLNFKAFRTVDEARQWLQAETQRRRASD